MERLTIVTWKWKPAPGYRASFESETVNVLRAMVARHYRRPHDFVCLTDDPSGIDADIRVLPIRDDFASLTGPNGVNCYRRLWAFSREAAEVLGPRFVSLDLDLVLVGDVAPLWDRPEDFVAFGDVARDTPYNGSMWLLRAGSRPHVWETFDPVTSPARAKALGYIGSDQAWMGAALGPNEPRWGPTDGVYSWPVHLKKGREPLPRNARVVVYHGAEKPWAGTVRQRTPWVREHYSR